MDGTELLDLATFEARGLDALPWTALREMLARRGIARVRGVLDRSDLLERLAAIGASFSAEQDRKHDPRDTDAVRRNFQKLQIGANSGVGTRRTLGRFLRILFNPIFADDIYGMRRHFVTLARFRNRLYGLSDEHAVFGTDDGFFTCARLHQYPRGGGFMVPHRDVFGRAAVEAEGTPYYQCFALLSEKGTHYEHGGAYIDTPDGRMEYEGACHAGDVIIYDGRTVHGVADIDPQAPLELERFGGRVAAFASLFRHLAPGDGYAALSREGTEAYAEEMAV